MKERANFRSRNFFDHFLLFRQKRFQKISMCVKPSTTFSFFRSFVHAFLTFHNLLSHLLLRGKKTSIMNLDVLQAGLILR